MKRKTKADEAKKEPNVRRVVMRRRGMVFSSNTISSASEGGGVADTPEQDHPDLNLNQRVVDHIGREPAALPAPEVPEEVVNLNSISNQEDFNPASRLQQVGRRSSEYEREYRLELLSRLLMRKIPLDEIAAQMGISVRQVSRDRLELSSRMRQAAKELNIDEMVGSNTGFYEEVSAMAMRAASNAQIPIPMRLAAMRTALAGRNDQHRFLQAAGVYDVLRFRRAPGGEAQNDIQQMMTLAEELMADRTREQRESTAPNPLGDFSGADTENMDL